MEVSEDTTAYPKALLSIPNFSYVLDQSVPTTKRMVADGQVRAVKVRGSVRIPASEVDAIVQRATYRNKPNTKSAAPDTSDLVQALQANGIGQEVIGDVVARLGASENATDIKAAVQASDPYRMPELDPAP